MMKRTVRTFALSAVLASFLIIQGCSTETSVNDPKGSSTGSTRDRLTAKVGAEAANRILNVGKSGSRIQSPISYAATLCDNVAVTGTAIRNSIYDSAQWTYYKFYATAGSFVTVKVTRTGCGIDPAFNVFQGTTTDNEGITTGTAGPDMSYITFNDDDVAATCGCYADPYVDMNITTTGWYTVAVYDFLGCEGDITYELVVTGITCDSDGDGINDSEDAYPNSDMSATVTIDGCNSGVANKVLGNGASMMDLINDCAASATNHGGFVSCVSSLTNTWKSAGLITGSQKGSIQSCASNAAIP